MKRTIKTNQRPTPNGPVMICKKDGEPFDIEAKKSFYQMLGHQILPL